MSGGPTAPKGSPRSVLSEFQVIPSGSEIPKDANMDHLNFKASKAESKADGQEMVRSTRDIEGGTIPAI